MKRFDPMQTRKPPLTVRGAPESVRRGSINGAAASRKKRGSVSGWQTREKFRIDRSLLKETE